MENSLSDIAAAAGKKKLPLILAVVDELSQSDAEPTQLMMRLCIYITEQYDSAKSFPVALSKGRRWMTKPHTVPDWGLQSLSSFRDSVPGPAHWPGTQSPVGSGPLSPASAGD